jgi:sigma-B regulation protein RsbU (phosphoserine phosphatase)
MLKIITSLGIASWIAMLGAGYLFRFSLLQQSDSPLFLFLTKALLLSFILFLYLFYRQKISRAERFNIVDHLWRVFVTGLVATVVSLSADFLLGLLRNNEHGNNPYFLDTLYLINVGLVVSLLMSTFMVWKGLILYQKRKWLIRLWQIFDYGVLSSALLFFLEAPFFDYLAIAMLVALGLLGIFLSVNLKWVAYLNFKQKWKSILLIILIALYIVYFYNALSTFSDSHQFTPIFSILNVITIDALFIFVLIYCTFSVLVILFNLPTSSVFEQKLVEIINFQRLSQLRNTGQSEDQVFAILLESSTSVAMANAAWLDIMDQNETYVRTIYHNINKGEKERLLQSVDSNKLRTIQSTVPSRVQIKNRYLAELKNEVYKSILVIPVFVQEKQIAVLNMVKDVKDGFTKEMVEIVRTFINQAGISIENARLIQEAIETERYKEELKIAKRVQDSILPDVLHANSDLEITGFSKAAAEVGGDYYDTYKLDENRLAVIIVDVSGKGTSAAFHVSQMKGVFQSLVQMSLTPQEFMITANIALSSCLDRRSFITATYFIVDSKEKTFQFSRAGHCPAIYYSAKKDDVSFLQSKGMGLGIVRNHDFDKYVDTTELQYAKGDVMLLYTDGITEARNKSNEEFGYDRLKEILAEVPHKNAEQIKEDILNKLYDFCGSSDLNDDITTVVMKIT